MGLFDTWNVSGIITGAAKSSEPFYILGNLIADYEFDIPDAYLVDGGKVFLRYRYDFDQYFVKGIKSQKTAAVKFLVVFAAYLSGKDGAGWDWQAVRHPSQGLYGSMEESPADFLRYNTPLIESATGEVSRLIAMNS